MTDRSALEHGTSAGPAPTPSRHKRCVPAPLPAGQRLVATLVWGPQIELSLDWRGDRWGHTLNLLFADERRATLLASQEGTPQQAWPPSPPLQALERQTLADGRQVALLVGMAGRSHWSASFELEPGGQTLRFDLACRHAGQPGWIGSTCHLTQAALAQLEVVPLPGTRIDIVHLAEAGWDRQLRVWPAEILAQAGTVRWGYELRLHQPSTRA